MFKRKQKQKKLATEIGMSLVPALRRDFCEFKAILVTQFVPR